MNLAGCSRLWIVRPLIALPSSPCRKPRLHSQTQWNAVVGMTSPLDLIPYPYLCTRSLKGPTYETGSRLQAAAGVHHLIGNLWHVLVCMFHHLTTLLPPHSSTHSQAETLDKKFEKPLRQHLDTYKTIVNVCFDSR